MDWQGKTALVTGGSQGIGKVIALSLGRVGCQVVVNCANHLDKAESVAAEIRAAGGSASAWRCNVADEAMVKQMFQELAPVEDQRHISMFFEAAPDSTLAATNREQLRVVDAIRSFPETEFTWSLTANWGGFGGLVAKDWRERSRSTEQMYGDVYMAVSQVPGLRVFPRLDPPLPTPGQYDVELVLQSDAPPAQMLETAAKVIGAGMQSGKFLYVDTDLKIDLPEARVVLDRERIADLGLDLASVGRELGTLLGGNYVNRFNWFDRSYKVIPQVGDEDRASPARLLDLKVRTPGGELVPVSTFARIETTTAPRTLNRFQQRNAVRVFGGVAPGITKEEGLRVLEEAARAAGAGVGVTLDHAGESRQIRHEGQTLAVTLGFSLVLIYLVLAAQFHSFRDPLIVLLGSVPLAISGALVFTFVDLTTINIYSQVGLITLVGLIAKNGILIVEFANKLKAAGLAKMDALREASLTRLRPVLMTSAATVFAAQRQALPDLLDAPAAADLRAQISPQLSVAVAGERLVGVGVRGIVLLSDDGLYAVRFVAHGSTLLMLSIWREGGRLDAEQVEEMAGMLTLTESADTN